MGNFLTIFILIWKNFMLQVRHPWITAIELVIPVFSMLMLILFRLTATILSREIETSFDSYDVNTLPPEHFNASNGISIYYTPKSSFVDWLMTDVAEKLNVTATGFDSEANLVKSYQNSTSKVFAGIVFHSEFKDGLQDYGTIRYTIKPELILGNSWNLSYVLPPHPVAEIMDHSMYGTYYMTYGVLPLQHAIARTFINYIIVDEDEKFDDKYTIEMQRQPYPPYKADSFYKNPEYYVIIAICISFAFPAIRIAKNIVHDRENNLKPYLIAMGVSSWENWIAWFIKDLIFLFFCCLIMTAMLCIRFNGPAVLNQSDPGLVLLWLILYGINIIVFTFFITTFFDKANAAVAATFILYILTFLPYVHFRKVRRMDVHEVPMIISCLLPNTLFAYSVRLVLGLELQDKGLEWNTLYHSRSLNIKLNMHGLFLLFIVNIFLYLILTWYIEGLHPSKFGEHHLWYFPFTRSYWSDTKNIPSVSSSAKQICYTNANFFEEDPIRVKPMIDIQNLTKRYSEHSKPVIDNVDIRAYKGQITALLGENSSGKSTLANILSGTLLPTAGTIIMKGHKMYKSDCTRNIQHILSVCPEFDISIDELNIKENLLFFCAMKGFDCFDPGLKVEVNYILGMLDLEIKKKRLVSTLASSSKRCLSIAIALVGESEIVILDQPTRNMNSSSRRFVWDALRTEKAKRAIFITTSHLKEADALGDKIAVLQNGRVKCCGSPLFLRKLFGAGYLLTISKQPDCNTLYLKNLISAKIPDVTVKKETESELKVLLPLDACSSYEDLFKSLEGKELKINKMSITLTTMREFSDKIYDSLLNQTSFDNVEMKSSKNFKENSIFQHLVKHRNEGCALFNQHIFATLEKKFLFSKRNLFLSASQILLLPFLVILSNLIVELTNLELDFETKSIFNLKAYEKTTVVYGIDPSSNATIDLADTYASLLEKQNLDLVDLDDENYLTYLLKIAKRDFKLYTFDYIIGAVFLNDFNKTMVIGYYNAEAYHSAPTSLLYLHNAILALMLKDTSVNFEVEIAPLPPKHAEGEIWSTNFDLGRSFFWSEIIVTGLAILMSSFVVLLVFEKTSKCKRQQYVIGLDAFSYWFSSLIYDLAIYVFPCILIVIILVIFQADCLYNYPDFSALFYLLILHGLSALLFVFCCTFCFSSSAAAYIAIFLYYSFGLCLLFVVYRLENYSLYHISEPLNILFSALMPSYCVARGIYNIHRNCMSNIICDNDVTQSKCQNRNVTFAMSGCCLDTCEESCIFWSPNHASLSISGIGLQLIALIVQSFVWCILLILLEMEVFQNLREYVKEQRIRYYDDSLSTSEETVQDEAYKILHTPLNQLVDEKNYLILKNASKFLTPYAIGKFSFGVKKNECFGVIGIDNAGKSTILEMISGSMILSTGSIYISGINIQKYPHLVLDKIGLCFGKHTLHKELTVRETLTLYARIRGIPEAEINNYITSFIDVLSLRCNDLIKCCSITSRKKICVAIAMIGTPPLILLDDPRHIDIEACVRIEEAIKQVLNVGCTVFFTTRTIQECEQVCNRIGILIKGKLSYIGDIKQLHDQYRNGYTLIIRVGKVKKSGSRFTRQAIIAGGASEEVKGLIEETFSGAVLKVESFTTLNYFFPHFSNWSKLFGFLEKMKSHGLIIRYSFYEINLEQIFLYHSAQSDKEKDKDITEFLKERKRDKF